MLTALVERVRATSKKTEKVALIADVLRQARGREAELLAMYLTGTLPQGRIGLGWRTHPGRARGCAAAAGEPLALLDVDRAFDAAGRRARGRARRSGGRGPCARLLERAREDERRFLAELVLGEVRQGALDGLVQEAIARAAGLPPARRPPGRHVRARAWATWPARALEEGAARPRRASRCACSRRSRPCSPAPADDVAEALERLGEAAFEYKLDGARIQLHKAGDEVRVFTRQLQDVTARVPELVEWARALRAARAACWRARRSRCAPTAARIPFQVTMQPLRPLEGRRRPRARELPLSSFFFDCLYREGEGPLVALPYARARASAWPASSRRRAPAAPRHARRGRGRALPAPRAGRGPRRPDGQVAGGAVRRRASAASTG